MASAINCVWDEFKKLNKDGIEQGELEHTKAHLKGNLFITQYGIYICQNATAIK